MDLTLEVTGTQSAALGAARRKVFARAGGTIGRVAGNQWVLQHQYVSSRHAVIHYEHGGYSIEDQRSANGVFINSLENRLPVGERYALKDGDTIYIDPFEIRVSLAPDPRAAAPSDPFSLTDLFATASAVDVDAAVSPLLPPSAPASTGELDPMNLLGLDPPDKLGAAAPRAEDLNRGSLLSESYRPPAPTPAASSGPVPAAIPGGGGAGSTIPEDWLRSDESLIARPPSVPPSMPPSVPVPRPGVRQDRAARPVSPAPAPAPPASDPPVRTPRPQPSGGSRAREATPAGSHRADVPAAPPAAPAAGSADRPAAASARAPVDLDLAQLLTGAGLDPADVTPELAQAFGQILRVVVSGMIDVLQARRVIKEEFRLKNITHFERVNNNPLKFSANVDDALHNLLVKRNTGYLGPVEAFEDAFGDLRNHQLAMLEGIRVAFEAMLAEFDPTRLQEKFDREIKKGALLSVPARLQYWELYREKFSDMVRDAEASFAALFGDEFARAYEAQLERLKVQNRSDKR